MSYSTTVLADSPTGYWRLGEPSGTTAADSSGNSRNGTYTGSPTLGATGLLTGDADTAMTITTAWTQNVECPSAAGVLGNNARTLEAWFKSSSAQAADLVWTGAASTTQGWNLRINASGHPAVAAGTLSNDFGGSDLNNGTRHHVVLTYDGTTAYAYVDGSQVGSGWTPGTLTTSTATVTLGMYNEWLSGTLDECAVYASALSSTRVLAHYTAGTVVTPTWTTPTDTVSMSTTPELKFTSPTSAAKQHFYLQLDTANTFATGSLQTFDSSVSQTNWAYWDGAAWTALPSDGLPIAKSGNEVRFTVTSALSATTWYRRVRAGTLA